MVPIVRLLKSGSQMLSVETCPFLKRVKKLGRGESIKEFRSVSKSLRLKINNMEIEKRQIKKTFFTDFNSIKIKPRLQKIGGYNLRSVIFWRFS